MHFSPRLLLPSLAFPLTVLCDKWPFTTFQTNDFTPPELHITKSGAPTAPGYLFIGPRGNQPAGHAPLIYTDDGDLVYQGPQPLFVSNFRVDKLGDQDVLTWWEGEMLKLGFGYGSFHVLDNTYQEIHSVYLTENIRTYDGSAYDSYADEHESLLTPQGTVLMTAYNVTQADLRPVGGAEDGWILDGLFYEVDLETNEVLFSWSALDHLDSMPLAESHQVLGEAGTAPDTPYDAFHINSVEQVKDGYIISIRHHWSGYYINKDGSVKWRLDGDNGGDFTLGEGTNFSWQHDMRIHNETDQGMILDMFNNENTPDVQGGPSTGLRLSIDLVEKTVTAIHALTDPEDPVSSISQGSYRADLSNGHGVLGYGSVSKVKEFDEAGNAILTAQFGENDTVASYRGFKCEWSAIPFWSPDVAATQQANNQALVSMSWNGATTYTHWNIYAIQSQDPLTKTLLQTVPRTGFETTVAVDMGGATLLQVMATEGDMPLRVSEIISVTPEPPQEPAPPAQPEQQPEPQPEPQPEEPVEQPQQPTPP